MKFFAVFACVIAVAVATPSGWTLHQLSEAIESEHTDPALKPALEHALNIIMDKLFAGEAITSIAIQTQGSSATYNMAQLDYAISHSSAIVKPHLEVALNQLMENLFAGEEMQSIDVKLPAMDITFWTLQDLDAALSSATTSPALIPYLENALNELMTSLFAGSNQSGVVVATPVQVAAVEPIVPAPTPVVVAEPEAPAAVSAPLVQIILNVQNNGNSQARN